MTFADLMLLFIAIGVLIMILLMAGAFGGIAVQ